jgi:hypothetical protein
LKLIVIRAPDLVIFVALLILSSACGQVITLPTSVLATATPTLKPLIFPTPPAGWTIHTKSNFQIALPESWKEVKLDETALKGQIEKAGSDNPHLADALTGILQSGQYKTLAFYAVDGEQKNVVTNVAIAQTTVAAGATVQQLANDYADALPQRVKGAKVVGTQAPLEINGLSAAEIDYDVPLVSADGKLVTLRGVQFLFLLDSANAFAVTITGDNSEAEIFMTLARQMGSSFVGVRP